MARHHLKSQDVSLIVGVNQGRPSEWLHLQKPVPEAVRRRLERWEADGCPSFPYWQDLPEAA